MIKDYLTQYKKNESLYLGAHSQKRAFTLAEVLITLGIIGIIAAMTLPVVIGNYQKKVTVEKLKTVFVKFSEVIMRSEMDNGEASSWDYSLSPDKFAQIYFSPYITNFKLDKSYWVIKGLDGAAVSSGISSQMSKFSLANGTLVGFFTSGTNNGTSIMIYVDINGVNPPNVVGRDVFRMSVTKIYGFTLGADRSDENAHWSHNSSDHKNRSYLLSENFGGCNTNGRSQFGYTAGDACSLLIMLDGWKISDDYPWYYKSK